ncbi:Serine/threonine-protein kinase pkn5 [Symmachiella macrocystis]|uniref:non-specific serine/threonine protein kinase n=1 Tax=Symmachiella macrocystis TaxID=2527985 RepID=A0A5C6B9J3_9PLAN|nr:protein kinase [Symmachiella macrocystis]TWU08945.1 Serine/threonine-protein kinase pkn5 [Symmachiella macrocystis]
MTTQHKAIDEIFAEAVDIDSPEERAKYLEEACGENVELKLKVERLVCYHFSAGDLMEQTAAQLLADQNPESSVDNSDIPAKRRLGDFELFREIGRGGMGVVYEAHQISLNRHVALKVLPFTAVLDQRQLERFKTEAQAAAGLHHGNIVPVFHVGQDRAVHYYAMQYIEGQDVSDLIKQLRQISQQDELALPATEDADFSLASNVAMGRFEPVDKTRADVPFVEDDHASDQSARPASKAVAETRTYAALSTKDAANKPEYFRTVAGLGIQAAEALEFAHQNGILHRDIKPSNLMLDAKGKLWITDFGLARIDGEDGLTMTGDVMGTLRYMSPEQASGDNDAVDHRSDVYSLGVTLYEMLSLTPIFPATDRYELLQKRLQDEPASLRQVNHRIPADLVTIIHKAIAKEPAGRYATAQELADDLRRYLNGEPIFARCPSVLTRVSKWAQRNRTLALSFAAAFLGGIVAASAVVLVIQNRDERPVGTDNVSDLGSELNDEHDTTARASSRIPPLEAEAILSGLIPHPRNISGLGRWQIITKRPCVFTNHFWSLDISPDGQCVAFGEGDDVRVYSIPEFELLRIFSGHSNSVIKVAWSPDGSHLASASADNTLRLWEYETGLSRTTLVGHQDRVNAVAWHPNGKLLASGGEDTQVRFWTIDGRPGPILTGHTAGIRDVSWSRQGDMLASASKDGTIRIWDAQGKKKNVINSKLQFMRSVAWSPDGQQLVTTHHGDHSVRLWGIDGTAGPVLRGHGGIVTSASWSPDGKKLLSSSWDGTVHLWNADGTPGPVLDGHNSHVESAAWSPDGQSIIGGGGIAGLRIWELDGSPGTVLKGHPAVGTALWSPSGDRFSVAFGNGESSAVEIWDAGATSSQSLRGLVKDPGSIDWSPNGEQFALVEWGQPGIRIYNRDGTAGSIINTGYPISRALWSPNGRQIAVKMREATDYKARQQVIQLWNLDGTAGPMLPHETIILYGMAWNPDGDQLAAVTYEGILYIWSVDGTSLDRLAIGPLTASVAWKPDGTQLATGSDDGTIRLWSPDGHPQELLKGHEDRANSIAWSPDSQWIASGGRDSHIRLWTAAGKQVAVLKGHHGDLGKLSWHPEHLQFLSCGADGTVRLWDAVTMQPLWISKVMSDGQSLKFSPDGKLLSGDNSLFNREFAYIVEKPNGTIEILTPKAFLIRTQ